MNKRIKELAIEAGYLPDMFGIGHWDMPEFQNFVRLFKKALMQEIAGEYVGDAIIDAESNKEDQFYLHGNNGGVTDAILAIQNFGEDIDHE